MCAGRKSVQLGVSESSRGCSLVVLAFTECEPCSIAGGGGGRGVVVVGRSPRQVGLPVEVPGKLLSQGTES